MPKLMFVLLVLGLAQAQNLTFTPVATDLERPTFLTYAPDGSGRLFITEQTGKVRVVQGGRLRPEPFLDLSGRISCCGERGLLSLVFHPDFKNNGFFFVNYTRSPDGATVVARYKVAEGGSRADPASAKVIITIEQPYANHNGGQLAFGPDGYLYIGMGDGGASGDRFANAQNPQTLLGAMLRIAPSTGAAATNEPPYGIPDDNPFVNDPDYLGEIWATGLRNPWRYSFDAATGELYIADVGQNQIEEINLQPADSPGGENYGWPITEGFQCYQTDNCSTEGLTLPIAEYSHEGGNCSVTGGYVYRGQQSPAMRGVYFYADYCSGNVWGLRLSADGVETRLLIEDSGALVSSFGQDENLELYLLDMQGGTVYHLAAG